MKEMVFQEEQRVPRSEIIWVTGIFILLAILPFVSIYSGHKQDFWNVFGVVLLVATGGLTIWLLRRFTLRLKVNNRRLAIRSFPFKIVKRKIKWKHVDSIEMYPLPKDYQKHGWNVHFSTGIKWFNLSGKALLHIRMKDGDVILVGCRKPGKLLKALRRHHTTRSLLKEDAYS